MIYTASISTPANTVATAKKRTPLPVTKGLVYKVEIDFPFGSAGLLHCQIRDQGFQIWPTNQLESFNSPGFVISFEDTHLKSVAPFQFDVYTWNLDDTYAHGLQVRIGMVSEEAFIARFMPGAMYKDMLEVLRKVEVQQEIDRQAIVESPFGYSEEET